MLNRAAACAARRRRGEHLVAEAIAWFNIDCNQSERLTMSPTRTKAVFIAGTGHSGSTLLDLILGSHSRLESVGEVRRPKAKDGKEESMCTCGSALSSCSYWGPIFDRMRIRGIDPVEFLQKWSARSERSTPEANETFVSEVLRQSGKQVYVESSKTLKRLACLSASAALDVYVLHLVRDGRAYTFSNMKRGYNPHASAVHWWRENHRILAHKQFYRDRWMNVRYETLARSPAEEIKKIMHFIGEDFEDEQMQFKRSTHHNLAGNRMRYSAGKIISPDTRYIAEMDSYEWAKFTLLALRGLWTFDYPLTKQGAAALLENEAGN